VAYAAVLWLGVGEAQAATFSYIFGLDTNTGTLGGGVVSAATPGSARESQTYNFGSRNFTSTASAAANPGVVSALAQLSAQFVVPGFFTARPEAVASMTGSVTICAPSSTAQSCLPPSAPIPFPYPNLLLESTVDRDGGLAQVTGVARINGDVAGTATGVTSGMIRFPSAGPGGMTPGSFSMQIAVSAIASCSVTGCNAVADASNSLKFVEGEPAFLGLPAGYTIFAPDFNIADNRWTDPRKPVGTPAPIPLPAGLPLLLSGLLALGVLRRRNRR
jgi:hypothetical protein